MQGVEVVTAVRFGEIRRRCPDSTGHAKGWHRCAAWFANTTKLRHQNAREHYHNEVATDAELRYLDSLARKTSLDPPMVLSLG